MDHAPDDLRTLLFLQAFPGYTRRMMLEESPHFIERAHTYLLLQARNASKPQGPE